MNVMIIPAAGRGTRLAFDGPKLLYPLLGKPLLHYLIDRYKPYIDQFVIVIHPSAELEVSRFLETTEVDFLLDFQHEATGMLDAITMPMDAISSSKIEHIWISWCDQVSITAETALNMEKHLTRLMDQGQKEYMVLPTAKVENPYIHLQRDTQGKITQILQRREQDSMPDIGENDCGLFALSQKAFFDGLKTFAGESQVLGGETQERNFLPFIAWLNQYAAVDTFPATDLIETVGINTVDDATKIVNFWSK